MLTKEEKQRLQELTALKKKSKLSDSDFKEFKALVSKSKSKSKGKEDSSPKGEFTPGNDFSWWAKFPELIRDSASMKCNYIAGRQVDPTTVPYVIPGVLEVQLRTCYNPGCTATDPVNVWARNLYLKMFQKYRPVSSYSASDLGMAILAGCEVVKMIAMYERIYGIINRYSVRNVNMPMVEAEALGLSSSQVNYLQSHLSDFRYDLNFLIKKAQRLCIPKDISFLSDAISLLGYEYIDHDNPRGQIIIFNLINRGYYDDVTISTGGYIAFVDDLLTNLFDFNADNMCKILDTTLNGLVGSDSIQRIYADLVVWFGEEAMIQFLPVPEDYVVVPIKSDSILHKLHNAEMAPSPFNVAGQATSQNKLTSWAINGLNSGDTATVLNGNYNIYQYNDAIVTVGVIKDINAGTPTLRAYQGITGQVLAGTTDVYGLRNAHVIDGYNVDVTPEFVVEGSLLKYTDEPIASSDFHATIITSCVNWLVNQFVLHVNANPSYILVPTLVSGSTLSFTSAGHLAVVDWAPLVYDVTNTGTTGRINIIAGDVDVILPISAGDLSRIQITCFMSGIATDVPVKA